MELLKDCEEVIGEALEGGVTVKIEVVGVGGAGADVVVQHDTVVVDKVRDQVLPYGLVGAEPVSQYDGPVAGSDHLEVVGFLENPHNYCLSLSLEVFFLSVVQCALLLEWELSKL